MKVSSHLLSVIMRAAWSLAKQGSKRFGGGPRMYFACALRISWSEQRTRTIIGSDGSERYWMPGAPIIHHRRVVRQLTMGV